MVGTGIGMNTMYPDIEVSVHKLAEYEYTHVYFDGTIFFETDERLGQIAQLCNNCGVIPFAAHAPWQFIPSDPAELDQTIGRHKANIDKAAILRCNSVTFHVASVQGVPNEATGQFIEQVGKRAFDEMNWHMLGELARHAGKHGMSIAVENLSRDIVGNYCRTVSDLKKIIDGAGQPNVGICIDTGHANISGLRAADLILEAGDLLIETHFNDNFGWLCPENAVNDLHRPPGIGTVDWLRVVEALDRIGYQGPIDFELGVKRDEETLDDLLRLTRDNWRMITRAWQYVKAGLPDFDPA
jgi:sugar phosphate isomerase/epimerase